MLTRVNTVVDDDQPFEKLFDLLPTEASNPTLDELEQVVRSS